MTDNEMSEVFREMREEPVPADSLVRVRAGVEERIGKRSWIAGWKIAAALVMAGCIVAGFVSLKPAKPVTPESPPEIARVTPEPAPVEPPEIPVRTVARPRRARSQPVKGVPVSIRIETPDPDVVILLVN